MADRDDDIDSLDWAIQQLEHQGAAVSRLHDHLRKCLDYADRGLTKAIARALKIGDEKLADRLRKADNVRCDAADMIDDARDHIVALARHIKAARVRADEISGPSKAALRRREKAIASTKARMIETDAVMAGRYPAVPLSFKVADPARQVHVVLAGREHADVELSNYRDAVLLKHAGPPIAWCFRIGPDYAGRLVASAQFPPAGVSARADKAFESVKRGGLSAASVGLSVVDGVRMLKEWSLVPAGADPEALVTHIGGAPVGGIAHLSAGELLSPYGVDNARAQAKRLYAGRWGI